MRQHFLNDDIAFEMRALVAAIFFRPGHADPALGADLAGKGLGDRERRPLAVGREHAGLDLLAQEGAHLLPQFLCLDRKSTRLNSSHMSISYAVFCLKKKKNISCIFMPTDLTV